MVAEYTRERQTNKRQACESSRLRYLHAIGELKSAIFPVIRFRFDDGVEDCGNAAAAGVAARRRRRIGRRGDAAIVHLARRHRRQQRPQVNSFGAARKLDDVGGNSPATIGKLRDKPSRGNEERQ